MISVHDILERNRAAGRTLSAREASVLFAAATRLAAAQGATLRSRLVQLDEQGVVHLLPFDDNQPEPELGYLAPELLTAEAPRKSEPRVQVYAAGALGYELLTGRAPGGPEADLPPPLGDLIKLALAPDRRERFGDLTQLYDAVEGAQPRIAPEQERQVLLGLRGRPAAAEKEALAKLIGQIGELQKQVAKLSAGQGDLLERLERFEDGSRLQQAALRKRGGAPVLVPALVGAAAAMAAVAGLALSGVVPGMAAGWPRQVPPPAASAPAPVAASAPAPADAAPATAAPATTAPATAAPAAKPDVAAKAEPPAPQPATAAPDAGAPEEPPARTAPAAAAPKAPPPAAKPRSATPGVSPAALVHAVAQSQVKRGEQALEDGRVSEAVESFRAALDDEPALPAAYRGLGTAYTMQGAEALALQSYERYLQLAPAAPDAEDIRRAMDELKARAKIGAEK